VGLSELLLKQAFSTLVINRDECCTWMVAKANASVLLPVVFVGRTMHQNSIRPRDILALNPKQHVPRNSHRDRPKAGCLAAYRELRRLTVATYLLTNPPSSSIRTTLFAITDSTPAMASRLSRLRASHTSRPLSSWILANNSPPSSPLSPSPASPVPSS
jgi:hypothetical protein